MSVVKQSLLKEYNDYCIPYYERYGEENMFVFFQVGKFYQLYEDINLPPGKASQLFKLLPSFQTLSERDGARQLGIPVASMARRIHELLAQCPHYLFEIANEEDVPDKKYKKRVHLVTYSFGFQPTLLNNEDTAGNLDNYWVLTVLFNKQNLFSYTLFNNYTNELLVCQNENQPETKNDDDVSSWITQELASVFFNYNISNIYVINKNLNELHFPTFPAPFNTLKNNDFVYTKEICDAVFTHVYPGEQISGQFDILETANCVAATLQNINVCNADLILGIATPKFINKFNLNRMYLYKDTVNQLETKYLLKVIDNTCTVIGSRFLKEILYKPFKDPEIIQKRLALSLKVQPKFKEIKTLLLGVTDFVKTIRIISTKQANSSRYVQDLYKNWKLILQIYNIENYGHKTLPQVLNSMISFMTSETTVAEENQQEYHFFKNENLAQMNSQIEQYYKQLMDQVALLQNGNKYLNFDQKNMEKETLYLVITKNRLKENPDLKKHLDYHKCHYTFVSSSVHVKNPTLDAIKNNIETAEQERNKLFTQLYRDFSLRFSQKFKHVFYSIQSFVEEIDIAVMNNINHIKLNYHQPVIVDTETPGFDFVDLRHPVGEQVNQKVEYIPNNIHTNNKENGILLYGVNGSGKSCIIKAVGCNIIMAQAGLYGSYKQLTLSCYSHLITQVDFKDSLATGQSAFDVESSGLCNILDICKKNTKTLVIADELTKGTETLSGITLFVTTLHTLINYGVNFIFTSHLHEVAKHAFLQEYIQTKQLRLQHLKVDIEPDLITYRRKLQPGPSQTLYGLQIAEAKIKKNHPGFIQTAYRALDSLMQNQKESCQKQPLVKNKVSTYNSKVVVDHCQIQTCKYKPQKSTDMPLDTHHINMQCSADTNGNINKQFHKNTQHNLVVLCKECHIKVHQGKLKIYRWVQTSNGIKLEYET